MIKDVATLHRRIGAASRQHDGFNHAQVDENKAKMRLNPLSFDQNHGVLDVCYGSHAHAG